VAIPKSDVRKAFGQRVRLLRKQRGYSQEGLAERADLHFTYVSSVERGERNISLINIVRLARALKVMASSLFQDIV
jgi:transcriptional regulator with XRE-family HTH domain